ncbi:MAG: MOSC domain-containing protein [Dehalococcoidia bacterium]|nr:MOSC domain-containing protein [Dehalococcoidia bacterium]
MRTVAAIFTSPVKSLALLQPESVTVGYSGIVEDRRFHLIDADGRLLTQRQVGRLALVQAGYSAESEELTLKFPDGTRLAGPTELGNPVSTAIWGRQVSGNEVTGDWNQTLADFCGSPVRLVKTDNPGDSYDEYPVSLLSQASIDKLGDFLIENVANAPDDAPKFEGRRFRPNFLLDGCSPHEEDFWLGGVVQIGPDLRVRLVAPDPRCAITTLDPDTGERDFNVPKLLQSYRPNTRAPYFGVYGSVEATGIVSVGDTIELVKQPAV